MPLFMIASRVVTRITRRRVAALLAFAASTILIGAALFSITQHLSFGASLYWAITTATTVGYGDIDPHNTIGRIIANAVMLTTIPTIGAVFALWTGSAVLKHFRRLLGMDSSLPTQPYTVVYGDNPVASRVLEDLAASGDPVVLVADQRPAGSSDDFFFIAGNPADESTIRTSHPERANRALIAASSDSDTLVIAVAIHHLAPDLELYALTQSPRVAAALKELGVNHTLAADALVGHTLAKSLETPQAGDLLLQMVDTDNFRLQQLAVDAASVSKRLSAVRAERPGALVLGIARGDHVDLGLSEDPTLAAGDNLIVLEPQAG